MKKNKPGSVWITTPGIGLIALSVASFWFPASAAQKIEADTSSVIQIYASINDANIITLSGGSIESAWSTEDKVSLQANDDTGQAIFKPLSTAAFTLFVQSYAGNTYTLQVQPRHDIIGQTIILDEFGQQDAELDRATNVVAFKNQVKRLLKDIESVDGVKKLKGYQLKNINREIPLWAETKILHAVSWIQSGMIIDKFVLTNISEAVLIVEEREFSTILQHIRSVAIRKHRLKPAESTVFYTVRKSS